MNPFVLVRGGRKLFVFIALCLLNTKTFAAHSAAKDDPFSFSNLAVGTNADGRLEIFQVDRNGDLRHRWQGKSPHEWSSWSTLGTGFFPGVTVASDAHGRLMVFAVYRTSKVVRCDAQQEANSTAWSNWLELAGPAVQPPLAAGLDGNGQMELFAVAADKGTLRRARQSTDASGWTDWKELGAVLEPGPVVARNATGELEVFGIDARTHQLLHSWQTVASKPDQWSAWSSLGETMSPGFAVGPNSDGRLEIAGVTAADGQSVHASQLSPRPDSGWTAWQDLGGNMKPAVAMGRNDDGRIEIFTVDTTNNMIFHAFQKTPGATTNWARSTDMGATTLSYPAVGNNFEGLLEIFAVDPGHDEVLIHRRIIRGNLLWTDWVSLDHSRKQYMSRIWRTEDGLPDNRIQAIAQTRDGYLWIGTHGGLARFDGVLFSTPALVGTTDFFNTSITCLLVDFQGTLWAGSEGKGLARVDGNKVLRYGVANGLAGNDVTSIVQGKDSTLWIGTQTGLSRLKGGGFTTYSTTNGLLADSVTSMVEDTNNNLWVTTTKGLTRLGRQSSRSFTRQSGLPENSLKGIWQDEPGRFWIGSSEGMILYRGNRFFAYGPAFGLSDRFVNVIRNDSQGTLWVGTCSGLNQFEDGMFLDETGNQGSDFGRIDALFEDREHNIWAGSQNGLVRLTPKRLLVYDQRHGLTRNNITSVMEDDNGSLWIGTSGGGLDQLKDQSIHSYTPAAGFSNDVVLSVCQGRDGTVWAGSDSFGGLTQLKNGKIKRCNLPGASFGTAINALMEDHAGNLWIGCSDGLQCMREGEFKTNEMMAKVAGTPIHALCEGRQGEIWFGTDHGLIRSKESQITMFSKKDGLPDNVIKALYEDQQQVLWIGTQKRGLVRFKDGVFNTYSTRDGLFSDEIFEIVEDDFGWLWMTCSKGIFRVRKAEFEALKRKQVNTLTSIAYGHDDGMESVLCSQAKPGGCKTRDGQMWFPTSEGLVSIDAKSLNTVLDPPPVYLEQVVADHKSLTVGANWRSTSALPSVRVPAGSGDLEFHYTALNFQRPERLHFKYRLDGFDSGWVEADTRRVAYYNNLAPGTYTFSVIACNNSGIWNELGAGIGIILLPHFWQTWWFRILLVVLALGTVAAVYHVRKARSLEIERIRLRIAADLHDDIGSNLASIALLSQLEEETKDKSAGSELSEIHRIALSTANGIREIVWFINPECDTLPEMIVRMKDVAAQMLTGVEYCFQGPDRPGAGRLSPEFRRNVFLVFKEILHNITSHAQSKHVDIQLGAEHDVLLLKVSDDGRGFNVNGNSRGNGLRNMRLRVQQLNGALEIISACGKGTAISVSIKIT